MYKQKTQKPPLGVVPRIFWLQDRAEELSSAIAGHVKRGYFGGGYLRTLKDWSKELIDTLEKINELEEQRK